MGKKKIVGWEYTCERCRKSWKSIAENPPVHCPKCNSPYWDRPRREVKKKPRVTSH